MTTTRELIDNLLAKEKITDQDLLRASITRDNSLAMIWRTLLAELFPGIDIDRKMAIPISRDRGAALNELRERAGLTFAELNTLEELQKAKLDKTFAWQMEVGNIPRNDQQDQFMTLVRELAKLNGIDYRLVLLYIATPNKVSFLKLLEELGSNE